MSILLVDNDTKCRKSLAGNINQRGYKVKECSNWKEAIDIIKKDKISLILANAKITNALVFKGSSHKNLPKYILFSTDLKPLTENSILFESLNTKFLCDKMTDTKDIKVKDRIKIIVTDPNEIIRFGVKSIIENINTFEFIGGASNFFEAKKLIKKSDPNILILSIDFSKTDEISQWKSLKKQYSDIHFIVLTDNIAPLLIQENFCQWIDALLLKSSNQCDIVYAITKVMIGGKVLDPLITKKMFELKFSSNENKINTLTDQELKILYGLALGKTNNQIAKKLCLSPSTIRNYTSKILNKLNLPNRSAAIAHAFKIFNLNNFYNKNI